MNCPYLSSLSSLGVVVAVLLLMPSGVARQVSGGSTPARAVWGTPYLQVDLDQLIRDVPVDRTGV